MRPQSLDAVEKSSPPDPAWHEWERESAQQRWFGLSIAITSLVLLALLWVGLLTRNVWIAELDIDEHDARGPTVCTAIEDWHARLHCYDQELGRPESQPAKGARAPLKFFSAGQAPQLH